MQNTPSQLTDKQVTVLITKRKGGASVAELARQYDMVSSTLRDFFTRHGIGVEVTRVVEVSLEEVSQQVRYDRQVEALGREVKHYKKLYAVAVKASVDENLLIETIKDVVPTLQVLAPSPVTVPRGKARGVHGALAFVSDIHGSELVNLEATGGLGEYNLEIFRQRAGLWANTFLRLMDLKRSSLEIPTLDLFLDGDMVSGIIHDELVKTNQINVMDSAAYVALIMSHVIARVAQGFEETRVSCTVGNHGRLQQKVEFKEPHASWDYVCYQMMAQFLVNHEHIKFDIPRSTWQITRVVNHDWLHFHGHGIRSWNNIPYYGINRALKELREALVVGDRSFSSVAMGHFHEPFSRWLPTKGMLVVNGNWKGGDEYALGSLHTWTAPIQLFTVVHDKRGPLGMEPIFLEYQTPEDAKGLPERLPDVWATERV